ncbi:MAG: protein translocase subunit SecD [Verrucomicrobia bacterium]|nr:protein translocase subunit SecD [Verrucomicrobiota bacterium]
MSRNLLGRFLFLLFVLAWSLWETYPPQARNLIDVFNEQASNRDTNFTAIVQQAQKLQQANPQRTYANLVEAVGTNDLTRYFPGIKLKDEANPNRAILLQLQRSSAGRIKLGLDLQGGTSLLVALDTSKLNTNQLSQADQKELAISQALEVLRRRVDRLGVTEPILTPVDDDRIEIQLPGLSEAEKETARNTIKKVAFLEFRLVHERSSEQLASGLIDPGYEVKTIKQRTGRADQQEVQRYVVKRKAEQGLTGNYIVRAGVEPDPLTNEPHVTMKFNSEGAILFEKITTENVGRQLAIVLDGELYSAPVIRGPIGGGNAVIEGRFTVKEAYELAYVLENPLQVPVSILQEYSVEPSLGKDSIESGIRASLIGTILVSAFMLVYYLFAGLVANVALLLNVIILIGVMCSIDTTLTLPGIAGIVLTIGMAVDANVLIFERMREESAAGKSIRGALAAGYDKAFGTILDSNLTTLISAIILIALGSGPVKGFGVTLTIGIAVSMFTALVVTRLIFDWLLSKGWLKSVPMLQFVKQTHFDFLKWAKPAFIASWLLIAVGMGSGIYRGRDTLGVDFAGGDRVTLSFAQKIEVEQIRGALSKAGISESFIQYQKDLSGLEASEVVQITTPFGKGTNVVDALNQNFNDAKFVKKGDYNVGPTVGAKILQTALISTVLALFGILAYVAFRYEYSFALGAVFAIIHDVFMTTGWFCLTGREFSAPMVAAILTIIGFSINDTIVIFDRIREDLKLGIRGTFKDVINTAVNQTLSRTIITSGTVLLATLSLYIFGGPVINDFAFTFLVGILTGTYSTIYIASAFVLWWHKGERPTIGPGSQVALDDTTVTARA